VCIVGLDSNKKGKWRSTGSAHLLCFAFCLVGVAGLKRSLKEETAVLQNSYYILGVFFVFFFRCVVEEEEEERDFSKSC
jgi:hypothetical protein